MHVSYIVITSCKAALNISENIWQRKHQPTQYIFFGMNKEQHTVMHKREEKGKEKKKTWRVLLTIRPARPPLALNSGMTMEENGRCCQTHIIQ